MSDKQLSHNSNASQTYSRKRSRRAASYTQVVSFARQLTQAGTSPEHLTSVRALDRIQTVTTIGSGERLTSFAAQLASSGAVTCTQTLYAVKRQEKDLHFIVSVRRGWSLWGRWPAIEFGYGYLAIAVAICGIGLDVRH